MTLVIDSPKTMFDKIWERHEITKPFLDGPSLLYIDRDIIHEGSFHAFSNLKKRNLDVRLPKHVLGVPDHYAPTRSRQPSGAPTKQIKEMIVTFDQNMRWANTQYFPLDSEEQGIVHVVGPEQAFSLPGQIVVCSDSHTSTHGALGAIAFGIGQSENTHVLATHTLWQKRPKVMRINVDGKLCDGVTAKDVILFIISTISASGATGYAIEYTGEVVRNLTMEGRLTLCNMSIEAGARCGMVAPDETTFNYIKNKRWAPKADLWDQAVRDWKTLKSDKDAKFDAEIHIDGSDILPMVTWGTSPEEVISIEGKTPVIEKTMAEEERKNLRSSLDYMGLQEDKPIQGVPIDMVFIGSCTNSRIEDLRSAARVLKGKKSKVSGLVVPGSEQVRKQAEVEGLDQVFIQAGLEWGHSGCSMCVAMNGDSVPAGKRCASTSNRNFKGRQGPGARTHLMSPMMVAAAAVAGHITDVRKLLGEE